MVSSSELACRISLSRYVDATLGRVKIAALEKAMIELFDKLVSFLSANLLLGIAGTLATLVSVVALVFVLRRNIGPGSRTLAPDKVSDEDVERRTDEIVRLLIKKDFLKDLVSTYLEQQADKPRFT